MSYVECLNNRYGMDIPLTCCVWLSELGVEMLSRVLPDREPMLTFYGHNDVPSLLDVVQKVGIDYHGNVICDVPFGIRFKSSIGKVLQASLIEGYLYRIHWIGRNENVGLDKDLWKGVYEFFEILRSVIANSISILVKRYGSDPESV